MSVSGSDGSVRILADFAPDEPLPTLAADSGRVYWLNTSGRVYALTRMALR
jgi:hypothetical protein